MKRRIIVDEKVIVWRRTEYDVDDTVSDQEFLDRLRELSRDGQAYAIEDMPGVHYTGESDYLPETEEPYSGYGDSIEVFDEEFNSLGLW